MGGKDGFKEWLHNQLEEEMSTLHFSQEAKSKVRAKLIEQEQTEKAVRQQEHTWWNKIIVLPRVSLAAGVILLLVLAGTYARTLFWVTPQEIANFKADRQIILPSDNTPFAALQMAVLQLPEEGSKRK